MTSHRTASLALTLCMLAGAPCLHAQEAPVTPLPRVLVIGDSVSMGYMNSLTKRLEGHAIVVHNPGNAKHSAHGLAELDKWLGNNLWDVIHFNHGLHDLKYVDSDGKNTRSKESGHRQIPLTEYEKNIEAIVVRLKKTGAKLIFATTTPYPNGVSGPLREVDDVKLYNDAALRVMKEHGVAVNDLCSFVEPRLHELQKPNNVHFTPEGSRVLADQVSQHIRKALDPDLK